MPRLYVPPEANRSAYNVGQSARDDARFARADQINQRNLAQATQRSQQSRQYQQSRQGQRLGQRQAQQQQALQIQQRREDRDFQQQRDVFGAQRDYGMQERRIGAAAEQSQLGREFETEQLDTRFGQQQDMARQEQEYRLEELDIAAQDRFLSTDQQAEIQRESDILRSDLNRTAASEGRFEQFEYGQLAAEEAARRPLSVAERQRLRFGDELDARSQGRGAGYRAEEQKRADEFATGQAYLRQGFDEENVKRANQAKEDYLGLTIEGQLEVNEQLQRNKFVFQDQEVQDRVWEAKQKVAAAEQAEDRDRKRQLTEAKENELGQRLQQLKQNATRFGGRGSAEYMEQENRIRDEINEMSDAEFRIGPSPQTEADRARVRFGKSTFVKTGNGLQLVDREETPVILDGKSTNVGETVNFRGNTYVVTANGLKLIAETPEGIREKAERDWKSRKRVADYNNLIRESNRTLKTKDMMTGNETETPAHSEDQLLEMRENFNKEYSPKVDPPPEAGGAAEEDTYGEAAGAAAGAAADQPKPEPEPTNRWGLTPEEDRDKSEKTYERLKNESVNRAWASNQKKLIEAKNVGRTFPDWSPDHRAIYLKALDDLEATGGGGSDMGSGEPTTQLLKGDLQLGGDRSQRPKIPFPRTSTWGRYGR
jgi:hypothetical protein